MSNSLIRKAFEVPLAAWAAARNPVLQVAFQNAPFTPPNVAHLLAYLLPAGTTSDDLAGQHRRYEGTFQVTVRAPADTGPAAAAAIADGVVALFPLTQRLLSGGVSVVLLTPMSEGPPIQEPGWYSIPLSCAYRCDTV
jgi:hypothetical protein